MTNHFDAQLQSIDMTTLQPLVRQALRSETVEVTEWQRQQLHGGVVSDVYRFWGEGIDQGEIVPWSLILKVVQPSSQGGDPSRATYHTREVLAYQSGLLHDLPGGLLAPECYGIVGQPGGAHWLWLEDVGDDVAKNDVAGNDAGARWPVEHYGVVARHLGRFNGAYLMGRPIPSHPWLTNRGWWHEGPEERGAGIALLRSSLDHPLVARCFPPDVVEDVSRLCDEDEIFLEALNRLPRTFCHRDAFARNLFARRGEDGGYRTVAIDWAVAGTGALGEEIVPLVLASLFCFAVEMEQACTLDRIVFDGYLQGLAQAGWHGDPRLVRLGYTAGSGLRYGIRYLQLITSVLIDERRHAWAEQLYGRPIEEQADHGTAYFRFLLDLAAEARLLLSELGW